MTVTPRMHLASPHLDYQTVKWTASGTFVWRLSMEDLACGEVHKSGSAGLTSGSIFGKMCLNALQVGNQRLT